MSKKDYYLIEKNVNKIIRKKYTNFLDPSILKKVIGKLKEYDYKIYSPYNDSDKVIIYTDEIPKIRLLEIISYEKLTHREIMGSLYGLNIATEMFGDIIITNNHYYFLVMDYIYEVVKKDFNKIGLHYVKIKEVPLDVLNGYEKKFEDKELIVSSLRIDGVISKLIGLNRKMVKKIIYNKEVLLNYEICHKNTCILKENDIFSIRKYGKYKFGGITKTSKKKHYIIKCYKYIDN